MPLLVLVPPPCTHSPSVLPPLFVGLPNND